MNTKKRIETVIIFVVLVAVVCIPLSQAGPFKCALGILKPEIINSSNPATGKPWAQGDTYRFAFFTSAMRTAESADIEDYNAWVQALANNTTVYEIGADEGVTWKVIGSTNDVDARDNTSTNPTVETGCAVFLLDGSTLVASDNADLWDGEIRHIIDLTEQGTISTYWPFTGTYKDGTKAPGHSASGGALGASGEIGQGQSAVASNWIWRTWTTENRLTPLQMYALSDPITVVLGDPNLPSVDIDTPETITWSGEPVSLNATVVNNDTSVPQGSLSYSWTADPNSNTDPSLVTIITDSDKKDALVSVIKNVPTGDATAITLQLSVRLEGGFPITDKTTIYVYDDACKAALDIGQAAIDPADFNGDCRVDIKDVAIMAEKWFFDYSIKEPAVK